MHATAKKTKHVIKNFNNDILQLSVQTRLVVTVNLRQAKLCESNNVVCWLTIAFKSERYKPTASPFYTYSHDYDQNPFAYVSAARNSILTNVFLFTRLTVSPYAATKAHMYGATGNSGV